MLDLGSIEGERIQILSQKIILNHNPPKQVDSLDGDTYLVYPISTKSRTECVIEKEYNPKKHLFNENSFLEQDLSIKGKIIWGFSTKPLKANSIKTGGQSRTSSHTGQYVTISDIYFMCIIQDWEGNTIEKHPKLLLR